MIKVYRPPFFGAFGGGSGGAIAVYTKKGASANKDIKGLDLVNIPVYSSIKNFFHPIIPSQIKTNQEEDYRPTLYWNPFIITGKGHRRMYY